MFDPLTPAPRERLSGGSARALSATDIDAWTHSLTAATDTGSVLSDGQRVDAIRALERLGCVVTAAQATLSRELDASQRAQQALAGTPVTQRGRGVAEQVALARRESPHRGRQHLGLAKVVATELPHTWAAWRAGRINEWKATVVARETACLSLEHRLAVDECVASDPAALEAMGDRELAKACLTETARLDAAALVARRRKAESERRVTLRPAPDTMTYLTALLPVKDGVAVLAQLKKCAESARASGDERGLGQLMADLLVNAVAGGGDRSNGTPPPRVALGLMMSDTALLGGADDSARLDGFGPIPAELAREIVADACTRDDEVWLRRLYTRPDTGELVSMDSRGRFFRGGLAKFIRLRDQTCRTPWCDAPIRQVDHSRASSAGGSTSERNAQGLCEACNQAKEALGWRARPGPDRTIQTTTPTGHTHITRPPPVATIHRRLLPRLTIDYVMSA